MKLTAPMLEDLRGQLNNNAIFEAVIRGFVGKQMEIEYHYHGSFSKNDVYWGTAVVDLVVDL